MILLNLQILTKNVDAALKIHCLKLDTRYKNFGTSLQDLHNFMESKSCSDVAKYKYK